MIQKQINKQNDLCLRKNVNQWGPPAPVLPADEIIHTRSHADARKGVQISFTPTYEKMPVNMQYIMTNEYYRLWFAERANFEKDRYDVFLTRTQEKKVMQRRQIQRMMTHKRQNKFTNLQEKLMFRFAKPSPEKLKEMTLQKMRYKMDPTCPEQFPRDLMKTHLRNATNKPKKPDQISVCTSTDDLNSNLCLDLEGATS